MKCLFKNLLAILSLFSILSCTPSLKDKVESAKNFSRKNGFVEGLVRGNEFLLTTYQKITDKQSPFVFYIESDGSVYDKYGALSKDPTPKDQLLLKLACLDNRPNVVYIARPCQYTPPELNPKCSSPIYWTGRRMSEEVVSSINEVIKTINPKKPFSLVGYSGGGGIAVMLAARNEHTRDVLTIAGNLDIVSFNKYHDERIMSKLLNPQDHVGLTMDGSLNPVDYAQNIRKIPQLHLSGAGDKIVPSIITLKYIEASNSTCVHQKIIPEASHDLGWKKIWPEILAIPIKCDP
ncbi:MAG: alpha/beta hydrolase family protein [Janthinobacterium lividum]